MNQLLTLTITDIAYTGHGIGVASDGTTYHILGAFVGDILQISPYKSSERIHYAEVVSIVTPSPDRIFTPETAPFYNPHAPWLNLNDVKELEYKQNIINNLFKEYSLLPSQALFSPPRTSHYRNKSAFAFIESAGQLTFASFERGKSGGTKTEQTENILNHPKIEQIARLFLKFFNVYNVPKSQLKYLIIRYSYATDTCVARILVTEDSRKKLLFRKIELEEWMHTIAGLSGILVSSSLPDTRSAKVEKDLFEIGNITIKEHVLEKNYSYHPSQFFQIYPEAFAEILKDIENYLKIIPNIQSYELLDFFSGVGIIGIHLAHIVNKVIAVEHSPLSQKYAVQNAKVNNIHNFKFHESDVDQALEYIHSKQILLIDPPRSGLTKETTNQIVKITPKYIVYISCNSETQARDFKVMSPHYEIEYSRGYNLFPQTQHSEHLIILKRKNTL